MTQDEVIKLMQGNQLPQYDIRDAEAVRLENVEVE